MTTLNLEAPLPELFQMSCDAMMLIDQERRIVAMNPAMERLTGYRSQGHKNRCSALFHCEDQEGCPLWLGADRCPGWAAMAGLKPFSAAEYKLKTAEGKEIIVSSSYTPIQNKAGGPLMALVIMRDITEQKRREQELNRRATTDPLTKLPNRAALLDIGTKEIKRSERYRRLLSVAMADLDGFKPYNDAYGHLAGDELLKAVAVLLRVGSRAADFAARYGGDEFAFLLPESDADLALSTLQRLCHLIEQFPFLRETPTGPNRPFAPIRISFGVAVYPEDGNTLEALLCRADYRLLQAKSQGGNQVVGPSEDRKETTS